MRFSILLKPCLSLFLLLTLALSASASADATKMLPERLGEFRAVNSTRLLDSPLDNVSLKDFNALSASTRTYTSPNGEQCVVTLIKTQYDNGAYALLTSLAERARKASSSSVTQLQDIGTTGALAPPNSVMFFKGTAFVRVIGGSRPEAVIECARQLAATLDEGEGEVPPLVKHLPEADTAQERAAYAVSLRTLQEAAGNRPVLDAVSFDGGAEAITASYGPTMRLVIVEHATPQLATDNDTRIGQRLEELRSNQQPQPSAYKRVGNYAVFVFDAPSEEAVANLIKDVRYEQVVRWLGDNPRAFERAQRAYGEMTANVILTTLKATGLAIIVCLCTGGLFGGLVFMRRRAQAVANQSYSDAGGMVRLNIDESLIRKD